MKNGAAKLPRYRRRIDRSQPRHKVLAADCVEERSEFTGDFPLLSLTSVGLDRARPRHMPANSVL